jgi:hypothetical protein
MVRHLLSLVANGVQGAHNGLPSRGVSVSIQVENQRPTHLFVSLQKVSGSSSPTALALADMPSSQHLTRRGSSSCIISQDIRVNRPITRRI